MPSIKSDSYSTKHHALAGCIAGAGARAVIAPLDLLRIRLQLEPNISIWAHVQDIWAEGGLRGFYRGNLAATYLWMGYFAVQFSVYSRLSAGLHRQFDALPNVRTAPEPTSSGKRHRTRLQHAIAFSSGAIAGLSATLSTYPLDLCRTNFAARSQSDPQAPKTMFSFARRVWQAQGVSGFFAGSGPALYGIVPYMGLNFVIYESLVGHDKTLAQAGAAGAISGGVSKFVVYPLDTVKKRLQVQAFYDETLTKYKGIIDCFVRIIRDEGASSLYRGLIPSVLKNTIATSLSFALYTHTMNLLTTVERRATKLYQDHQSAIGKSVVSTSAHSNTGKKDQTKN